MQYPTSLGSSYHQYHGEMIDMVIAHQTISPQYAASLENVTKTVVILMSDTDNQLH